MGSFFDAMSGLLSELMGKPGKKETDAVSKLFTPDGDVSDALLELADRQIQKDFKKEAATVSEMLERAEYYANTGQTEAFKRWIQKAEEKAVTVADKASVLSVMGKYIRNDAVASSCYEKAAGLMEGSDLPRAGDLFHFAGVKAYFAEDYQWSIGLLERAISYLRSSDDYHKSYKLSLHALANVCFAISKTDQGMDCLATVIELFREDGEWADYYKAISQMASQYMLHDQYEKAIPLFEEALGFFQKENMALDAYSASGSLDTCRFRAGLKKDDSRKQERYEKESTQKILKQELANLEGTKRFFGSDMLAQSLSIISDCLLSLGRREDALAYAGEFVDALRDAVIRRFRSSGPAERETFWEEQKIYVESVFRLIDRSGPTSGSIAAILYDIALLEKAILLNSSIEFQKILRASGDKALEACYLEMIRKEERIRQQPDPQLVLETEKLNMRLMDRCRDYKDYTQYLSCSWNDVRRALGESEASIEFLTSSAGLLGFDNFLFAIVLRSTSRWPVVIPLCSAEDLETVTDGTGRSFAAFDPYALIEPILPYLEGVRTVWFSPDRNLCHYGVEYCGGPGRTCLADLFETHRVSSTREVCRKKPVTREQLLQDTVLFGGGHHTGTGYPSLPYSRLEVIDIANILRENGFPAKTYTGQRMTKEALLSLSESGHSIIHIAAHGDYSPKEEDGMTGSILVLSDDEIVTAKEIASMNLHHCALVTLSTCHGSLGKLLDDGVFGLQRGFKNAGAGAILMSTGEVDDAFSCELMKSFYASLIEGKSLHDAFETARRSLRDNLSGAADISRFILLEA